MSKRKASVSFASSESTRRRVQRPDAKKHSLDSDEEDEHDDEELNADDIEGEEEGLSGQVEGQRMTAFNMKEELEEGHFDKDGHFIWKNEREIRDNWLDNVDWNNINNDKYRLDNSTDNRGIADEGDSASEDEIPFNEKELYRQILGYMQPKETVSKTLRRLGGGQKLSSVERLKRKKAGTLDSHPDVTKLTELANIILTETGNMNVYQETFEFISQKLSEKARPKEAEPELDMYADDFEVKEKEKIDVDSTSKEEGVAEKPPELMWEFKWDQAKDTIEGPFDTKQMIKWSNEGYFKTGVWVRKCGEESNFYTSNRIDFELYE